VPPLVLVPSPIRTGAGDLARQGTMVLTHSWLSSTSELDVKRTSAANKAPATTPANLAGEVAAPPGSASSMSAAVGHNAEC